jgi:tetratricopeptide (TPR) repeat protein
MKRMILLLLCGFIAVNAHARGTATPSRTIDSLLKAAENTSTIDPQGSLSLTKKALHLSKKSNNKAGEAGCLYLLGRLFYTNGAFSQSIRYHQEALRLYTALKNDHRIAEVCSSLGTAYYFARQPKLAMQQQGIALAIYRRLNDPLGISRTLTRLGHLYEKQLKTARALRLHEQALHYSVNTKDSSVISEIYENIGSVYEDRGDYLKALDYFSRALTLNHRLHCTGPMVINLNNIGDCYRKMGHFDEALHFSRIALEESRQSDNLYEERSALRDLYKLYLSAGKHELSHQYLDSAYAISEQIYSDAGAQQIALLGTFYELEKKDREIELLDKNKRNAQLTSWVYLQTGLILLILLFVIIWRQRVRIKSDRRNLKAQEVVLSTQQKLMQVELDNARLRESKLSSDLQNQYLLERELQHELQLRNQALSSHTLQLIEKNGLLENLRQLLLKAIKTDGAEKNKLLREVSQQIDFSFHRDRDWSHFEDFFSQVHTGFYDKLKENLPDISRTEQRLCALIKLKLASKEIAIILGITVDSLRIARYRLKKRFRLDESDSLGSFIELL